MVRRLCPLRVLARIPETDGTSVVDPMHRLRSTRWSREASDPWRSPIQAPSYRRTAGVLSDDLAGILMEPSHDEAALVPP